MPALIPIHRFSVERGGGPAETRRSLAPVHPHRYAGGGGGVPSGAHTSGPEGVSLGETVPAGRIEAPDGTRVFSTDPPILEIPGRGRVSVEAAIGVGAGEAAELGRLVRWRPAPRDR